MNKIRTLIVDDSALVRKVLTAILESDEQIEVIGAAPDPFIARDMIKRHKPDVITLDVEMPRMDGLTFLRNLMRLHPLPVVMVSTLTERGAGVTLEALELGAIDFVAKPKIDLAHTIDQVAKEIIRKVKIASKARVRSTDGKARATKSQRPRGAPGFRTTDHIIAIGASTGGTEAIREVITEMPPDSPGIVIAQHIPEAFSRPFAERLDSQSKLTIKQADDGDQILQGHVYIAPGGQHLEVARSGAKFRCRLTDAEPVNRHRPSVDVLFDSVAKHLGQNAVGVILTGMGSDGAQGLLNMQEAGAVTIAQDEASSVVWGMPGSAVRLEAADRILPLDDIMDALLKIRPGTAAHRSR